MYGCSMSAMVVNSPPKVILQPMPEPQEPPDPVLHYNAQPILIENATVMTAEGPIWDTGYVLMRHGKIESLGEGAAPSVGVDVRRIDGRGRFVTPGLIDSHSHMGVYSMPGVSAHSDGNEAVRPTTPEVWAEHAFWPQDPALGRALAGGVTTIQVLPGSANLIGGRSFVAKLHLRQSARMMRFPGAPQGLKIACGENPKRVYRDKGGPRTRMGNVAGYRKAFQKALEYRYKWKIYRRDLREWRRNQGNDDQEDKKDAPAAPPRNFGLETLMKVLDGEILVHNHCYRADEMHIMLDLAREFGFKIRSFHHALGAYKLAERLAEEKVSVSTWADWWGFKMEAFDGIPYSPALLSQSGVRVVIHSDDAVDLRRLQQEAAKAQSYGEEIGITILDDEVLRWVTLNPAWALGVSDLTGSLKKGKMADLVMWDGHPFSVYTKSVYVFIDGEMVYDRSNISTVSDFELGLRSSGQEYSP
jgi:imidazolonepropionase-like amidohydrolase